MSSTIQSLDSISEQYLLLQEQMFTKNSLEMYEEETKVIGEIPSIDSTERWFDFVVQLKLMEPIVMEDKELQ